MDRDKLIADLKNSTIKSLNMSGVSPDEIGTDTPLFGDGGLGLDSVDALELVVMLERDFGITVADGDDSKSVFATIGALADYVIAHKK